MLVGTKEDCHQEPRLSALSLIFLFPANVLISSESLLFSISPFGSTTDILVSDDEEPSDGSWQEREFIPRSKCTTIRMVCGDHVAVLRS